MDFGWDDADEQLYATIRHFAESQLNAGLVERERERAFPRAEWRRCGDFRLTGLSLPEALGGAGFGPLRTAHAFEALGRGCEDGGLVFSLGAHLFACAMPIAEHASEELKQQLLPRLASGEWVGANAITEAGSGSDAFAMSTRAVREGDSYVLDGTKSFVTNAPVANVFLVYATTRPAYGHLGISAFALQRETPGLVVGEAFRKVGLETSPMASIYLDGCRVPAAQRVGAEGAGATVFSNSMSWERTCLFAGYVGALDRQLEVCVQHARQRSQFGKPIGKHQAIAHRIADMKLRVEAARLLLYRACWLLERGDKALLEVACAKLAVSEAAIRGGLDAIQIHGGSGIVSDTGVERMLRDALGSTLFSGTSEIQRNIVAARLGL